MAAIFWSKNKEWPSPLSRFQMRTTTTPACFRYMLLIWFKWYESDGHDVGVGYAVSEDFEINPQFFEDTSDLVILRRANGLISGWDSGSHLPISKTRPVIRWTKSLSPFQPIETEMQPPSWPIEVAETGFRSMASRRPSSSTWWRLPRRRRCRSRRESPGKILPGSTTFVGELRTNLRIRSIIVVVRLTLRVWLPTYFGLHY